MEPFPKVFKEPIKTGGKKYKILIKKYTCLCVCMKKVLQQTK